MKVSRSLSREKIFGKLFFFLTLLSLFSISPLRDRLLSTLLHSLHCDVETHLNITGAEMQRVFKSLSSKDYSSYDYMIIFILTHGVDSNTIYAADGAHLPMNEIFFQFRGDECPSLAGKPKLFFVQACRGERKSQQ